MKTINEIYWHDANYEETQWLSKKDVLGLIEKLQTKKPYNERSFDDLEELKKRIG